MRKTSFAIFLVLLVSAVMISACTGNYGGSQTGQEPPQTPASTTQPDTTPAASNTGTQIDADKIVEITAAGANPKTVTITAGQTVAFVNKDSATHWPASALHPTHTVYPGSNIAKCKTAEAATIFDACKGLKEGEYFKFKFDQTGTWNYHDHLNPSIWGTVVVQ